MQLQAQLLLVQALFDEEKNQSELSINDIIKSLSQLSSAHRLGFSNVWVKILLEMPATYASSEHSFSGLLRIKTYLRTTMTQKRLNDLMVLNIHKQKTVLLNLAVVANKFVSSRENRVRLFGNLKLSSWVFTVSLLSYYVYDTFVISNTYLNCLYFHFGGRRHISLGSISRTTSK